MNAMMRRVVIGTAAVSMALSMAACGKAGSSGSTAGSTSNGFKIGLALPENQTSRYEAVDRPDVTNEIKKLCPKCTVDYQNAAQNANTQQQQIDTMINDGVKAIIIDAVDSKAIQASVEKANKKGIKVIAYDRLAQGPLDAYVSFDNSKVGQLQGQGLLDALGSKASSSQIVMINGDKGDPNAAMFKAGAHSVLDGKVKKIGAEFDTQGWLANGANQEMSGAITSLGKNNIAGVYVANDGMAAGVISALQSAHISPLPPVTGQDAQIDGVQRVIAGTQALTIYKPYLTEADTAAQMAIDLVTGKSLGAAAPTKVDSPTNKAIPSKLIPPTIMTKNNVEATVIKGGLYTVSQICTSQYAAACAKLGLK